MNWLHLGWLLASAVLAAILLALLFEFTDLDLAAIGRLLLGANPRAFAAIVLLLGLNNVLAGEKWRLIAVRVQQDDGRPMPRLLYFAFTSIGVALGQFLPAQLTLVFSRSLGAHLYGGRPLARGAVATLFDYFFDLLVAVFFALSSALVLVSGGGAGTWAVCTLVTLVAGFLLYGAAPRRGLRSAAPARLGPAAAVASTGSAQPWLFRRCSRPRSDGGCWRYRCCVSGCWY